MPFTNLYERNCVTVVTSFNMTGVTRGAGNGHFSETPVFISSHIHCIHVHVQSFSNLSVVGSCL